MLSILLQNMVPQASWFWRSCTLAHFSDNLSEVRTQSPRGGGN